MYDCTKVGGVNPRLRLVAIVVTRCISDAAPSDILRNMDVNHKGVFLCAAFIVVIVVLRH